MEKRKRLFKGIIIVLFIYFFFFQTIPFYIERPGSAVEINEMVEVDNQTDDNPGSYMLTTVQLFQATPFTYFSQYLPFYTGVSENQLLGNFEDYDSYLLLQQYYMNHSVNTAKAAAFNEADLPYQLEFFGVYVMSIAEESDFYDELRIGDSITEIDGESFSNTEEFIQYISGKSVGETVTLTVDREGETFQVSGDLIELEETAQPGIGISLVTRSTVETSPEVSIFSGNIGGPSAGFMFALQIYTVISEPHLRGDLNIAGTGTITEDGTVGRIGGVEKKVVAADNEGASIFFVPDDEADPLTMERLPDWQSNYEMALEAAEYIDTDMEIIPVKHLSDAINYLNELND
ncbi:SepM family pheromone-processing serine protease [Alkalibacterium iburiense]|uniref:endopeptidase La n=1 Tax=Alkalibacterium iburiense TaxID=290589 RepID=A0ABP3HF32_9LACT